MTLIWQSTAVLCSVIGLLFLACIADIAQHTRERDKHIAHTYAEAVATRDWNRDVVQYHRHETPKALPTSYECEFCGKYNRIGRDCAGCGHPQTGAARTQ